MNDAPRVSANAPTSLDIKSAHLPMVALMLKSADLSAIEQELNRRFAEVPDFFDGDPVLIDLSIVVANARRNDEAEPVVDFSALLQLLTRYKVKPIAVRGCTDAQLEAARLAGLLHAPEARVVAGGAPTPPAASAKTAPPAAQAKESLPLGAMVVDRPLRSGQQVYARGRDLVIMAMVNPGAEVIADGSIHIYAPLRGKAIAGARGNNSARIYAQSLEAELVSIAGIYRTSDFPLPEKVRNKAALIRLESGSSGDKLIMEPLG